MVTQNQASQNPSMVAGEANEVPPLQEELLAIDVFWGTESVFFRDVAPEKLLAAVDFSYPHDT